MRKEVVVQQNPKSPISEIFRTLRTNIQFMNSKNNLKSLLVTSTLPGEGKSWISANLAVTFAKAEKKVVIIDSDMRKGRLHNVFGVENDKGLSNYLSGIDNTADITKYIQRTEEPNLYVIPKGDMPPNPSELLSSEMTIKMIKDLEKIFDLVIFDGTPSLIVTDAVILSRLVDSTLIVSEYNVTKKENLAKVKRDIENVGGKIAGVVINKIPKQGKKYGSSYYYSYRYGYVYGTDEKTGERVKIKKRKKIKKEYSDLASENDSKVREDVSSKKISAIEDTNVNAGKLQKDENEAFKSKVEYGRTASTATPKISLDYVNSISNFVSNQQPAQPANDLVKHEQTVQPAASTINTGLGVQEQVANNDASQFGENTEEKRRKILEKVDEYINQIKK